MKINCVLIGLILCGGGGGAGAAGCITVQTYASIAFSTGTRVLIVDKLTGCCGHLLRQIGKIIWRSTQAVIMHILRDAIKTVSRLPCSSPLKLLSKFWGI